MLRQYLSCGVYAVVLLHLYMLYCIIEACYMTEWCTDVLAACDSHAGLTTQEVGAEQRHGACVQND